MTGPDRQLDRLLTQALRETAEDEVRQLQEVLDSDPALARQADALYDANRHRVAALIRRRCGKRRQAVAFAAIAASLALLRWARCGDSAIRDAVLPTAYRQRFKRPGGSHQHPNAARYRCAHAYA